MNEGFAAVARYLKKNGPMLFFLWQCLIFLKTHLKDKSLTLHRDRRRGNEMIGEIYEWKVLHHIHCVARSIYTGAKLTTEILGSFLLLPGQVHEHIEAFDYGDLFPAASSLIRLDDICFIAILNDANAALCSFHSQLQKIEAALSPIQIREVFAHMSYINLKLKNRPQFFSEFDTLAGYRLIGTSPDRVILADPKKEEFGEVLYYCTRQILASMGNEDKDQIREHVRKGEYTFLFDSGGRFIKESIAFRDRGMNFSNRQSR